MGLNGLSTALFRKLFQSIDITCPSMDKAMTGTIPGRSVRFDNVKGHLVGWCRQGSLSFVLLVLLCPTALSTLIEFGPSPGDGPQACNAPLAIATPPLVYSTYLFGAGEDIQLDVLDMAIDRMGRAVMVGVTDWPELPVTPGAVQDALGGFTDAFITVLSPDGSRVERLTYLGGGGSDAATAVSLDGSGDIYVVGYTCSPDFPTTEGAFQCYQEKWETFVTKMDANGTSLAYSTLLGGSEDDTGIDVTIDEEGNALVLGMTSSPDMPIDLGSFVPKNFNSTAFVAKLNPNGTAPVYCRYLKWRDNLYPDYSRTSYRRIALDADGRAYILGNCDRNGFLVRIRADGKAVSTLYVSPRMEEYDAWNDLKVVSGRYVYLVGSSGTSNLPLTHAPLGPLMPVGSPWNQQIRCTPIVCKLDTAPSTGTEIIYMVLLGGSGYGWGKAIDVDDDGCAYVAGSTSSFDFPLSCSAYQLEKAGMDAKSDAYLCKLSPEGSLAVYSTYLGGGDEEYVYQLALGPGQGAYLLGVTESRDFPLTPGAYRSVFPSSVPRMSFIARFSHAHLNPPLAEAGGNMTIGQHEMVVLNGNFSSDDMGIVNWTWTIDLPGGTRTLYGPMPALILDEAGAFNITLNVTDADGNWDLDGCVVTVRDTTPPVPVAVDVSVPEGTPAVLNGSASFDNVGIIKWVWITGHPGGWTNLYGPVVKHTFEGVGDHPVRLCVTDLAGNTAELPLNVTVTDATPPIADAGPDRQADQHDVLAFDEAASTDNVGVVGWRWNFVYDGQEAALERAHPSFMFDTAGQYVLRLTVWDAAMNVATDELVLTIRDTTPPVADAGPDREVPQHSVVTLDGTGSTDNVAVVGWTWSLLYDGTDMEFQVPVSTFRFDLAGTYAVRLMVRDAEGYSSWNLMRIVVLDIEPPHAVAGGNITVEQYTTVVLDGTGSWDNVGVAMSTWSFTYAGRNTMLNGSMPDFRFGRGGNYTIVLTVADAAGNTASTTMWVDVLPGLSDEESQEHWWLWPSIIALVLVVMTVVRLLQLYGLNRRDR